MPGFARYLISLLLFGVLLLPGRAAAQQGAMDAWFFAWNAESGQLVAYNAAGQVNPLLTVEDVLPFRWRLSPLSALALLSVNGEVALYQLNPQNASRIPTPGFDAASIQGQAAAQPPYQVLLLGQEVLGQGVLFNASAATNAITPLGESFTFLDTWRFSRDGLLLRYLSHAPGDPSTWRIQALDLQSQALTDLYSFSATFPAVQTNQYGDLWLIRSLQMEPRLLRHTLLRADGSSQVLAEEAVSDPLTSYTAYQLFEDSLLRYPTVCAQNCAFQLQTLDGQTRQTFPIEAINAVDVRPLLRLDEQRIVALLDSSFWLLRQDEAAQLLGWYDPSAVFTPAQDLLSPDGRWLVTGSETAPTFRLLDLVNGTVAYEGQIGINLELHYRSSGVLLLRTRLPAIFYRYADGEAIPLPQDEGFFFDALADGSLLYAQPQVGAERSAGIYRYDPQAGTYSLLVEDALPILLQQ